MSVRQVVIQTRERDRGTRQRPQGPDHNQSSSLAMSDDSGKRSLFEELKRRSVFRAAALYAVVAWLLVQIGEATFEPLGLPDGSQRLLIILVALGFPVAVVLAWIFDITPEGIVRTSDESPAVKHLRTGRRVDFAIIGALLIALGLVLWGPKRDPVEEELPAAAPGLDLTEILPPENPPLPDKPSIVVLPFDNLSDDSEQGYFADGITEELTANLSGNPFLFVIARNSAFTYKGKAVRIEDVGRELGVRYVVEGSVRKAGDRVRITAQLIDAQNGFHVWSESYERELSPANVFDIQSDIAQQIANALQVQLREWEGQQPTDDPTAWDLRMKAVYLARRGSNPDATEIRRLLKRAIELDPGDTELLSILSTFEERKFRIAT